MRLRRVGPLASWLIVAGCTQVPEDARRAAAATAHTSGDEVATLADTEPLVGHRPTTTRSFSATKSVGWGIFEDMAVSFYCGCPYTQPIPNRAGVPDLEACGYEATGSYGSRAERIEWEHIVPAARMGQDRECWIQESCHREGSTRELEGRACCEATDEEFRMMHSDLHNLVPAVGQINAIRSDHDYGEVEGEERRWGTCDFEDANHTAEPPLERRGDIARVYFYMELVYGMQLTDDERQRLEDWAEMDPVDDWERTRNRRVEEVQGNVNPFIEPT